MDEEFVEAIAEKGGISKNKARLILRALRQELARLLREEGGLRWRGFGSFKVRRTKQGLRVTFRASKTAFKELEVRKCREEGSSG